MIQIFAQNELGDSTAGFFTSIYQKQLRHSDETKLCFSHYGSQDYEKHGISSGSYNYYCIRSWYEHIVSHSHGTSAQVINQVITNSILDNTNTACHIIDLDDPDEVLRLAAYLIKKTREKNTSSGFINIGFVLQNTSSDLSHRKSEILSMISERLDYIHYIPKERLLENTMSNEGEAEDHYEILGGVLAFFLFQTCESIDVYLREIYRLKSENYPTPFSGRMLYCTSTIDEMYEYGLPSLIDDFMSKNDYLDRYSKVEIYVEHNSTWPYYKSDELRKFVLNTLTSSGYSRPDELEVSHVINTEIEDQNTVNISIHAFLKKEADRPRVDSEMASVPYYSRSETLKTTAEETPSGHATPTPNLASPLQQAMSSIESIVESRSTLKKYNHPTNTITPD